MISPGQISFSVSRGSTRRLLQVAALASFIPGAALRAATLTVTSPADSGPGTLRDQIAASNPGDTIDFAINGVITLNNAISIGNPISVFGPGPSQLVISGNNVDRIFVITASPVFLSGITVRDGRPVAPNGIDGGFGQNGTPGVDASGGAIYDTGASLTVSNCWFTRNQAIAGNGGRGGDNPVGAVFTPGQGGKAGMAAAGAIYHSGTLTAIRCTFSENRAVGGNGGNGGDNLNAAVNQSGGKGGSGGQAWYGAVLSGTDGPYMTLCTFSGNLSAGGNGGTGGVTLAPFVGGTGGDGNGGNCGAYFVSAVSSTLSCTIVSNVASGGKAGAGGTGTPTGPPGNVGIGSMGALCGYAIACQEKLVLGNTILAQNFADVYSNAWVTFTDLGYNYVGDNYVTGCMGATGTHVGTVPSPLDPLLEPLAQNGSGLPTHKPTVNSPVLDAGSNFSLSTDERGAPRPYDLLTYPNADDGSDIGAFEASNTELGLDVISNNVVLSWPAWAGDAALQSSTALGPSSSWSTVSNAPVVVGARFYVTNPIVSQRFYRLIDR
jgi:hypothetical protein